MTLDASRLSGATIVGDADASASTRWRPATPKTLAFEFTSERTGQVVASYLKFETRNGAPATCKFTLGVGERGVAAVARHAGAARAGRSAAADARRCGDARARPGVEHRERAAGTLPAGVTRIGKDVVTQKALALAEAGLRVTLGQPLTDAIRDLMPDFYGRRVARSPASISCCARPTPARASSPRSAQALQRRWPRPAARFRAALHGRGRVGSRLRRADRWRAAAAARRRRRDHRRARPAQRRRRDGRSAARVAGAPASSFVPLGTPGDGAGTSASSPRPRGAVHARR